MHAAYASRVLLSLLPCSVLRCSPQTLSAIAFVFLVASNVVAQDVAAEDAERPPSYARQPDAAGDEENANALLFPDHPRWMVSLLVGGAVAPLARGLQGEAHVELPWRMAMGFQGTYYRCDACDLGEEDGVDVEHLGVGFTYLGYSRPRGFFGGAVGYASGPSLFQ